MTVAIVAMLAILTGLSVANLAAFGTALFLLNDIKGNTCPAAQSLSLSSPDYQGDLSPAAQQLVDRINSQLQPPLQIPFR